MSDSSEDVVIRLRGEDAGGKALVDQLTRSIEANTAAAKKHADALRQTSDAGDQAGKSAERAKGSFEGLSRGLEALTTALAAEKLLEFVRSGVEAEIQLVRLSKETGASTEALSVLGLATKETGGSTEDLAQAFRGLSRSQSEVVRGNGQIAEAYHAIGLSVQDIQGLKPEELFKKVADAQGHYQDGLGKSAALQQIFGRNAQELLPVLNAVAGSGLAAVTQRAHELGIVLDEETAARVERFDTQLTDLKEASIGVTEQITAHLVPGLTDLARSSTEAIAQLPDNVKRSIDYVVAFTAAVSAATVAVKLLAGAAAFFEASPIGLAVTAVVGLAAIMGVLIEHERAQQQAALDGIKTTGDTTAHARELTAAYAAESRVLQSSTATAAEHAAAKEKLKKITAELKALGPEYVTALGKEGDKYGDVERALKKLNDEKERGLRIQKAELEVQIANLQREDAEHLARNAAISGFVSGATRGAVQLPVAPHTQQIGNLQAQVGAIDTALGALDTPTGDGTKPDVILPDLAALRARIAQEVDTIKADLKDVADAAKADEQANSATYAQGLEDLATYYTHRRQILETETAKEITDLAKERAAIAKTPTSSPAEEIQLRTTLAGIDQQIAEKRRALGASLDQLHEEERVAAKQLVAEVASAEATVLTAAGQTAAAARATIDTEVQHVEDVLAKLPGIGADGAARFGAQLRTALTANADFNELKTNADRVFAEIDAEKKRIEAARASGALGDQAAQDQTVALERARLPQLRAIGDQMTRIAQLSNNPTLIDQAAAFNAQLDTMGVKVDLAAQAWANFKDNAENALEGDLVQFLGSTIDQVHSVGDGFRQLALTAVQSLQRIVAELLVLDAIKLAKKTFGIGAEVAAGTATAAAVATAGVTAGAALTTSSVALSASGGVLLTAAAALQAAAAALAAANGFGFLGFAGGGWTGAGAIDEPAGIVHKGEVVFSQADVARAGGVRNVERMRLRGAPAITLHDFSHLKLPGYAGGGVVGADSTAAGALAALGGAGGGDLGTLHVSADEGLTLRHLASPKGSRVLLAWAAGNANKLRALLGGGKSS